MMNNEIENATVKALNAMIQQVEKGPYGFWVDDHEGCGNPEIFPEFKEGLKKGRLVQKEHYLCPWNTAVLYGVGHGNINTGCYYSCSIDKAKHLSQKMMKDILIRFKKRLMAREYDCKDNLPPLLTPGEITYIEKKIRQAEQSEEKRLDEERNTRLKKASALIAKHPNEESFLGTYYGEEDCVVDENGIVFFSPDSQNGVAGAEKMTYDEFLDVQLVSLERSFNSEKRSFCSGFAKVLSNHSLGYKGQIEKINKKRICFKRIFIRGMYSDGECFDGKEEHVWMEKTGFEEFNVGDCASFSAEVYRYVKTGNGKQIDYGLRNPEDIHKIEDYQLPSDEELFIQSFNQIICETCYLREHCNRTYCMLSKRAKKERNNPNNTPDKDCNNTEAK